MVAFKYRSKHEDAGWRNRWDWALFVGGFVPSLVFGVAVGNVLVGAPFRFDGDLRMTYEGTLLGLFTPSRCSPACCRWRCWRCMARAGWR
jgi:cytochrome d ubiquinol oxidase subunit II